MLKRLFILLIITTILSISIQAQVPIDQNSFWQSAFDGNYGTGMIWRDCNNDGLIDVFFSNGNDIVRAQNTIYINNGTILPQTPEWKSANFEYSGHCAVGDIDDNGYPDFMVTNYLGAGGFGTTALSNFYSNENGLPSVNPDLFSSEYTYSFSCAFGDVDGDGDLDYAMATGDAYNDEDKNDLIFFNVDGLFSDANVWRSDSLTMSMDVVFGDLDKNGYLDAVFCSDDNGVLAYYNTAGVLETSPSWRTNSSNPANTVILGDVNNDTWLDVVVANNNQLGGNGKFQVYFNDGAGNLYGDPGWESATGGYGSALALYDYDHDGDLDLATGRWWGYPRVYENTGVTFTTNPVWSANDNTVLEELAWIDVDGDGVEHKADTIYHSGNHKVFYTTLSPLQAIDSVCVDGIILSNAEYCFDLVSAWISLGTSPTSSIEIYYQYSFKNDLTVVNWDTYNYAYGNTNSPYVSFSSDVTLGWAPLDVTFTDNSTGASDQLWQFGDGTGSAVTNPLHTYTIPGSYDVRLDNTLADGAHNHTEYKMIIVLGDTIKIPDTFVGIYDTIKITISMNNSQPVTSLVLPVIYTNDIDMEYVDFDTDGCRTDYFSQAALTHSDLWTGKLTIKLTANGSAGNIPLPPGDGPIVNLYFETSSLMGTADIRVESYLGHPFDCSSLYADYLPETITGTVMVGICGDSDGDGLGPNVADLTYLVDYLFKGGSAPDPLFLSDVTGGGDGIYVDDLVYMVDYLFKGGPAPECSL